jgi:prepilin-type N-terminal cleavage/methylation domain-containing protein
MESLCPGRKPLRGFTLLEVLAALCLLSLLLFQALPAATRELDRLAVVGAREDVAGLFHKARSTAVAHGGARVRVVRSPPFAELLVGGDVLARVDLRREYRATLSLSRDRGEVELRYDAMGLGRVASQTIRFSRGGAEAALVISSYGRVRRE